MREHLFELSMEELKNLFIHETKALIFALEAGVGWEDLRYLRDSLEDITRSLNAKAPRSESSFWHRRKGKDKRPPPSK